MPYTVNVTWFRQSGKYYTSGEYITQKVHLFEIFNEVRDMARRGIRPGLRDCEPGQNQYIGHMEVPGHDHDHPCLIMPCAKE